MPKKKRIPVLSTIPEKITDWMGTPQSLLIHTFIFGGAFIFVLLGIDLDKVMLVLTTAVSLEAIYLSLFIQMSVNRQAKSIAEVEKDIDEILEDVESLDEISEDIDQLQASEAEEEADIDKTHVSLLAIESHIYSVTENLTSLRQELDALKGVMHQHKIEHPSPPAIVDSTHAS